jgi:hypothetical protein
MKLQFSHVSNVPLLFNNNQCERVIANHKYLNAQMLKHLFSFFLLNAYLVGGHMSSWRTLFELGLQTYLGNCLSCCIRYFSMK